MLALALLAVAALPVPFVPQEKDTCGAAALAMVLHYWNVPIPQTEIAAQLLDTKEHGIRGSRLAEFAREHGFTAYAYEGDLAQMRDFVAKKRPLIVAWKRGRDEYHYVVVVGFDEDRGVVVVHDPAEGPGRHVPDKVFEERWAKVGHWTLLVLPTAE